MTNDEFLSKYLFKELTEDVLAECEHFSCGVSDLDEYFQKDVLAYSRRMVSRSYVFCPKECPQKIPAMPSSAPRHSRISRTHCPITVHWNIR